MRLVFAVFSVPGIGGFFGTRRDSQRYKKTLLSLRDKKRDFDDEENESLYVERHLMRHTHTGEEGYFCETKKNISQRKKKMCVWRIFFFSLFFRVLLV